MNDYKLRAFLAFLETKGFIILDTASRESVEDGKVIELFNDWKGYAPIGSNPCAEIDLSHSGKCTALEPTYREEQARWREAGFDAYNCDMVDEFPTW